MRLAQAFRTGSLLDRLLDVLALPSCAACGGPRAGPPPFCVTCGRPAPSECAELAGTPLVVAGVYQPPLSLAIHRFKFEACSELAGGLGGLLVARLRVAALDSACFVPVPLHRARLVERGYNQSALIAKELARRLGARTDPRALERVRETEQQARLGREARRENVRAAFRVRGRRVPLASVLVDDVVTTGATALACVEALREAGSTVLAIVALARAEGSG